MNGDQFRVAATNSHGTVASTPATLTVLSPGAIATQPQSRTATSGQPASLAVVAAGSGPHAYRWFRQGVPIPGATRATYTIPVATREHADTYDVVVDSGSVSTRSLPVRLLVAPTSYPGQVAADPAFSILAENNQANVLALVALPDGRVLAGGDFHRFNGHLSPRLVRFDASGALDTAYVAPRFDATVHALCVLPDGRVLVAGDFLRVDDLPIPGLARLNADGSLDRAFRLDNSLGYLTAVARLSDGRIVVGGASPLRCYTAEGVSVSTYGTGIQAGGSPLRLAAAPDGKLYVGGFVFSASESGAPRRLARLNADGTRDTAFELPPTLLGRVSSLAAAPDGSVYVTDGNSSVSQLPWGGYARLTATGALDPNFTPPAIVVGFPEPAHSIALDASGRVVVATVTTLFRLTSSGAVDRAFGSHQVGSTRYPALSALLPRPDGSVWFSGGQISSGARTADTIAAYPAATGSTLQAVGTAVTRLGTINALVPDSSGRLVVGGNFTRLNGTAVSHFARLTSAGAVDTSFQTGSGPSAEVLQVDRVAGGKFLLRGSFGSYGGIVRPTLARIHADGTLDASFSFNPGTLSGTIAHVSPGTEGQTLAAGLFFPPGSGQITMLVRLRADGSHDPSFAGVDLGSTSASAVRGLPDGRVLLAGAFTAVNSVPTNRLVRLLANGTVDSSFSIGTGFDPTVAAGGNGLSLVHLTPDDRLMVAGPFTHFDGAALTGLVRLNAAGSRDPSFVPPVDNRYTGARGLHVQEDGRPIVWFPRDSSIFASPPPRVVRLTAAGGLDPTFSVAGLASTDHITALAMGEGGELYYALSNTGMIHRAVSASSPTIVTQPRSQTVSVGDTLSLAVVISAAPPPTFQWFRNNVAIPGATSSTYVVSPPTAADAGSYTVTVTNTLGSVTSDAAQIVVAPSSPTIVLHPADVVVATGGTATFTVQSPNAHSYQWLRNGYPLPGKTASSLTISPARRIDADYYSVQAINDRGTIETTRARLGVSPSSYPTIVAPDPAWNLQPENDSGSIAAMLRLPDGRVYLGGAFLRAGGLRRANVVRLLSDGSADPSFIPPEIDNTVTCLAVQADGRVLIGGGFQQIDGLSRPRLARLEIDGRVDATFNPGGTGPSTSPQAVAVWPDGTVLLAGGFATYNGTPVSRWVWLDRYGTLRPDSRNSFDAAPNSAVSVLFPVGNDRIAVGGTFTAVGSSPAGSGLALLRVDGSIDPAFSTGGGGSGTTGVLAVARQADGRFLVGGNFTTFGGQARQRLVRLAADGTLDPSFDVGGLFGGTVSGLAVDAAGRVLVSGSFVGERSYIVRLNTDGSVDSGFTPPAINTSVQRVALLAGDRILLAGSFASVDGSTRYGVARLDSDGGFDSSYNLGLRGSASIGLFLPLPDDKIQLARSFTYLRGDSVPARVARFDSFGNRDPSYNSGASGPDNVVTAAHRLPDGRLMLAGTFTAYNGVPAGRVVRVNAQGVRDPAFNAGTGFDGTVNAIAQFIGDAYVYGGVFTSYNGISRPYLACVFGGGELQQQWVPMLNGSVSALAVDRRRRVVVGGSFTTANGQALPRLARFIITDGLDSTFTPSAVPSSGILALAIQPDDKILVAGSFTIVGSEARTGLVRYLPDGTLDSAFAPALDGGVNSLLVQEDGRIVIRGSFPSAGGQPGTAFLARFKSDGALDDTFVAGGFTGSSNLPTVPAMGDAGQIWMQSNGATGLSATEAATLPVISVPPKATVAALGDPLTLSVTATSALPVAYQWLKQGSPLAGETGSTLSRAAVTAADAGDYAVRITSELGTVTSAPVAVRAVTPPGLTTAATLAPIAAASGSFVTSFHLVGAPADRKPVLVRAAGPALTGLSANGAVSDPRLELLRGTDGTVVAANDNWSAAANAAQIAATAARLGATPFATDSKDAALLVELAPGLYHARVAEAAGFAGGRALLEVFEADATPRLIYFATRAHVGTGADAWTQHVNVRLPAAGGYLVRALGPALGAAGALADPYLTVRQGTTVLAENDNWSAESGATPSAAALGAMALPAGSKDAAVRVALSGAATLGLSVHGVGGTTGVALVEVFDPGQVGDTFEPVFVVQPEPVNVPLGQPFSLGAVTLGRPTTAYQWTKDGLPLAGATGATYAVAAAFAADAGDYRLSVTGSSSQSSRVAAVTVVAATSPSARHSANSPVYEPGGTVTIDSVLVHAGAPTRLEWSVVLPAGWTLVSTQGDLGAESPAAGATGTVVWKWTTLPANPARFSYTVRAAATDSGAKSLSAGLANVRAGGTDTVAAAPGPLVLAQSTFHTADTNRDQRLDLAELLRVIQLYNTRNGNTRTGAYRAATTTTEDGLTTDPDRAAGVSGSLVRFHAADTNRDGRLSLIELTRVIELYNHRAGTTRTGAYRLAAGTEDGFAPGS